MAKKFQKYDGVTFYGKPLRPDRVANLTCLVQHGTKKGIPYSYIVFGESGLIKWKIVPVVTHKGRLASLKLYHRNRFGRKNAFHSQMVRAWGTPSGLAELIAYIEKHERWEKGEVGWHDGCCPKQCFSTPDSVTGDER
jgi:hypothetical protein